MAKDEEHLSPEEKLLRVIQGGGKKRAAAVPGQPPVSAPVEPAASAGMAPAVKDPIEMSPPVAPLAPPSREAGPGPEPVLPSTRLKLARDPAERPSAPVQTPAPPLTALPARRTGTASMAPLDLRTVNIVLAALVLVVLLFSAHEIWANVRVQQTAPRVDVLGLTAAPTLDVERELPPLEALLDAVDERPLFAVATEGPAPEPAAPVFAPPDSYCSLLGISRLDNGENEAIIMDSRLKKMLYLKVGDRISSDSQVWTVKDIQGDRVIFASGNRESVVR